MLLLSVVDPLGGPAGNLGVVYGDCATGPFCDADPLEPSAELSFCSGTRSRAYGAISLRSLLLFLPGLSSVFSFASPLGT